MQRDDLFQEPILRSTKRQKKASASKIGETAASVSKLEQKLIYQALQNSLIESESMTDRLAIIDEMPVFYPTEAEFRNPIDYVEKLLAEEQVHLYGCVKIVPPASFKPPLAFDT